MVGAEVQVIVAVGLSDVIVKWWVSLRHLMENAWRRD